MIRSWMYAARAASSISAMGGGRDGRSGCWPGCCRGTGSSPGSQKPMAAASDAWRTCRTSSPSIWTEPTGDVVQPRDQVADGGLAGPARPDQRDELAGPASKLTPATAHLPVCRGSGSRPPGAPPGRPLLDRQADPRRRGRRRCRAPRPGTRRPGRTGPAMTAAPPRPAAAGRSGSTGGSGAW